MTAWTDHPVDILKVLMLPRLMNPGAEWQARQLCDEIVIITEEEARAFSDRLHLTHPHLGPYHAALTTRKHMIKTGMFTQVSSMNEAFGNPKGDPSNIDWARIRSQVKNIQAEYNELMEELYCDKQCTVPNPAPNLNKVRDGLCDINVFSLGAHHLMGIDADRDMYEVVEALYSRFCRDEEHLQQTANHYGALGIEFYTEGVFPRVCLKSAFDQGDGEYPKGKFLKAFGYRQPTLYDVTEGAK